MVLQKIIDALEAIAPLSASESWDNVGLLAGDKNQSVERILLTIDYTPDVAEEARNLNCNLIIAYHPPLFSAVKRVTADGSAALIYDAVRRGVAIYSPHTAWDATIGGANDFLADILELIDRRPLRAITPPASDLKLVTFVPESHLQIVSDALFAAGAGRIGNYNSCSFRTPGVGTFFGEEGSHPAVGQPGKLQSVEELRLEVIAPQSRIDAIMSALRHYHPYEEPAFDLTVLALPPCSTGAGRIGNLPQPASVKDLISRLKSAMQLDTLLISGEQKRSIRRIAVCPGSGGELLDDAARQGAELYLTGELRHHDALKAVWQGLTVLCTLHSNSERPSLSRLKTRLEQSLAGLPEVLLSQRDRDPFAHC